LRGGISLRIFLDTSILSDVSLTALADKLAERVTSGDTLLISTLTHFQILWGYRRASLPTTRYEAFLKKLGVEVAPLVAEDAALAAQRKPRREDLVDALISATANRYGAIVWTKDEDFLQFLPKEKVNLIPETHC